MISVPWLIVVAGAALAASQNDAHVRIDQFGYRRFDQKIAILRNPLQGYGAPAPYAPGGEIQVRLAGDHAIAFSGAPQPWNSGALHEQSGDQVWWFDFSALTDTGLFYIHDPAHGVSSEPFRIHDGVYNDVLRQAARMYYYQRCGTPKTVSHAGADWADTTPCHVGPGQDLDCRLVTDPTPGTSRDLSGGWHDAGDYNKYVNFANQAVHPLLDAYEIAPDVWGDDSGIPESGNGIADLLDEIRWELAWLLKMQIENGSVLHKVSVTGWEAASPPSSDTAPRYYAPPTASATISACGMFAHGACVFQGLPDPESQDFADSLAAAALAAWAWLEANPGYSDYDNSGFSSVSAEPSHYDQEMNRLRAAAHLLRLTAAAVYRNWIDAHYQNSHLVQWYWASPWEDIAQTGLLLYATLPDATPAVVVDILGYWQTAIGSIRDGELLTELDAYRAYLHDDDYTWGSNSTKCLRGHMFTVTARLGIDPANEGLYRNVAADLLHGIHGVNPGGFCFLTHMDDYGSEGSVREMYHAWFGDGTDWDNADSSPYGPASGYLTGGVNPSYQPDPAYSGPAIEPPENQPIQKSYKDWNTGWPENSWEITECHIPYQAAYLRLLAAFASNPLSGIDNGASGPTQPAIRLAAAYPNPFNPRSRIEFVIPSDGRVRIDVYNVRGELVRRLVDESFVPGKHIVDWDGRDGTGHDLPSGIYIYRINSGDSVLTEKTMMLK